MSRIGKKPVAVPAGVTVALKGNTIAVKGPKGELARALHPEMAVAFADGQVSVSRAQRREAAQGAARPDPHPRGQHGRGRHRRLPEGAGAPGRRLQGRGQAATASTSSSGSPTRCRSRRRRGSRSRSRTTRWCGSRARARNWSGRWPPRSAPSGRPSPTRARASGTRASRSAARPARQERSKHARAFMHPKTRREQRYRRHLRVRKKVAGTAERPRLVVFRSLKHIYAQLVNDDLGVTLLGVARHRARASRSRARARWPGARRSASCWPRRPRPRASTTVVFDRAGYRYHGRVQAVADGAREGGLEF